MTQVVEADRTQPVFLQQLRELLGNVVGADDVPDLVHTQIAQILPIVAFTAQAAVGVLLTFQHQQTVTDGRHKGQRPQAGLRFCTVSLHQNSYPSPEVCGAQVFYFGQSQDGKKLADTIQDSLIANVDPDNHRVAKANESYYLLKKTPTPTVIVECGFLSNPTEADLLLTDDYQNKLVNAIYIGIQNYLSESM